MKTFLFDDDYVPSFLDKIVVKPAMNNKNMKINS